MPIFSGLVRRGSRALHLSAAPLATVVLAVSAISASAQTEVRPLTEVLTFDPNAPVAIAPRAIDVNPSLVPIPPVVESPPPATGPTTAPPVVPFVAVTPTTDNAPTLAPAPDETPPPVLKIEVEPVAPVEPPVVVRPTQPIPALPPVAGTPIPLNPPLADATPTPSPAPSPTPDVVVPVIPTTGEPYAAPIPVYPSAPPGHGAPVLDTLVGGAWGFNQSHSVRLSDGGIIVAGNALDPAHARKNPPRIVTIVAHVNKDGHVMWSKSLSDRWVQTPLTLSVIPGDGALLLLEQSNPHGYEQAMVLITKDGRILHDDDFGLTHPDAVRSIAPTPEGAVRAVGLTETSPGSGRYGFWHAWIGADAKLTGRRPLPAEAGLLPYSLSLTPTGGHVFAHYPNDKGDGWGQVWVAGMHGGSISWRTSIEGDARLAVSTMRDGGALVPRRVLADNRHTLLITRIAPGGQVAWDVALGHDLYPAGSSEFADGSLFVSGWGEDAGRRYGWFARLDRSGTLLQYETFETRGYDRITAGYPYPDGTVILVGQAYVAGGAYAPARVQSYRGYGPALAYDEVPTHTDVSYKSEVVSDDNSLRLVAEYDPAKGKLDVHRTAGSAPQGRVLELWAIEGDNDPVSLGVLPDDGLASIDLPAELVLKLPRLKLAVSDEPPGGSPIGAPTGQVLAVGQVTQI